jgi:hypothetical protein
MGTAMKKIAVHLPIYGRHDECLMTFAGLKRMDDVLKDHDIRLVVFPIVSDLDDYDFVRANQKMITIGDMVVADNANLGSKLNIGLQVIMSYIHHPGIDYVMDDGKRQSIEPNGYKLHIAGRRNSTNILGL